MTQWNVWTQTCTVRSVSKLELWYNPTFALEVELPLPVQLIPSLLVAVGLMRTTLMQLLYSSHKNSRSVWAERRLHTLWHFSVLLSGLCDTLNSSDSKVDEWPVFMSAAIFHSSLAQFLFLEHNNLGFVGKTGYFQALTLNSIYWSEFIKYVKKIHLIENSFYSALRI